ncbi:MAG TPA: AAA family ATPase, partial [Candidatus Nitrosotenuis sp.]|nr:AAA family ATPase [Candidatus Nitrosotenuis sp.]
MKSPKRIVIFGRPGCGKSTFALSLHQATGIPLYHLDKYFFTSNWVERDYGEFLAIQQSIIDQDQWIIDGNSIRSLEMRFARADLVLYFNYSKWVCL